LPSGKKHYRLTLADAVEAHDTALEYGGRAGIVSQAAIESAIGRPYTGYYRLIHQKAAALIHSVCRNHGFTDGNKRTAVILMGLFLDRSGYRLHAPRGEDINKAIEDTMVAIANGDIDFDEIETWLKKRIRKK